MVHEENGTGSVPFFNSLELSGHDVEGFFPRDGLEFPAAPFPRSLQWLPEAVFRVHDLVLGQAPGAGFQVGQWTFRRQRPPQS